MTVAEATPDTRAPRWVHLAWVVPFVLVAAPTLAFLWEKWTRSIWVNGHGLFVPLVAGILGFYALRREPVKSEEPSAWGFAFLVPALLLLAIDSAIKTELLSAAALLLALPGLSLLLLGPRRTRALWFSFSISFFMLPIPGAFLTWIHLALRRLTTQGSEEVLRMLGKPVLAEGTMLHMPDGTFHIIEECSGFAALYAAATVALILAYLSESRGRRVLLLLAAFPLAMASNVLRIVLLALLAEEFGYHLLDTPLHVLSGYMTFVVTLVGLFLLAERPHRRESS